jgi:2-keto-3-deoxy-L-rhamnonate aldolase RhmA
VIQIEHRDALPVLDEIFKVDGIDALLVGPIDLARSLGHDSAYGNVEEARRLTQSFLRDIDIAADRHAIPRMQFYSNGLAARNARADGCKFAIISSDTSTLSDGIRKHLADSTIAEDS